MWMRWVLRVKEARPPIVVMPRAREICRDSSRCVVGSPLVSRVAAPSGDPVRSLSPQWTDMW